MADAIRRVALSRDMTESNVCREAVAFYMNQLRAFAQTRPNGGAPAPAAEHQQQ